MKPLILLLFLSLAAVGCSSTSSPSSNNSIMPLALGNKWIGKVTIFDTSGNIAGTRYDTLTVYNTQVVNGIQWYYRTTVPSPLYLISADTLLFDTVHYMYANLSDGLYRMDARAMRNPVCVARYPSHVGDTLWKDAGGIVDTSNWSFQDNVVVSTNEQITVPAGTYTCYHYHSDWFNHDHGVTSDFNVGNDYYSPNLGLVQYDYYVSGPGTIKDTSASFEVHRELWQLVRAELH